jgi:hypothetical protein
MPLGSLPIRYFAACQCRRRGDHRCLLDVIVVCSQLAMALSNLSRTFFRHTLTSADAFTHDAAHRCVSALSAPPRASVAHPPATSPSQLMFGIVSVIWIAGAQSFAFQCWGAVAAKRVQNCASNEGACRTRTPRTSPAHLEGMWVPNIAPPTTCFTTHPRTWLHGIAQPGLCCPWSRKGPEGGNMWV